MVAFRHYALRTFIANGAARATSGHDITAIGR
jgi:hypothetical protein